MADLAKVIQGIAATQTLLQQLRSWGLERERVLAIIDRAEAEGREPTPEEVRAELADLGITLDNLERQIDQAEGESDPPAQ